MKFKRLVGASVCVVLLAASAAAPSLAGASETTKKTDAALLVEALAALDSGKMVQAVELYTRLINTRKLSPELLARALLNRGLAHQKLGQYAAAITDYDAALRIDALSTRSRVKALYNRALAFRARGDAGRAIEDLTAALYMDPAYAPAYFARGNILHERGLYYLALADYDQALAHDHPQKHRVHYARALLFSALNSPERTREALYAALKERPDFEPARKRLAAILSGSLPQTRLFADLVQRPKKRIVARIAVAGEEGFPAAAPSTATVMIAGAPVLNLRKEPQAAPVAPPAAVMTGSGAEITPKSASKSAPSSIGKSWRLASLPAVAPAAAASAVAAAGKNGMKNAGAEREGKAEARTEREALHTASLDPAAKEPVAGKTQPEYTGWAIQLAAQRSRKAAQAHWKKLKRKVRRRIRAGKPAIVRAEVPGRGIFYRVRLVGFTNRKSAWRNCRKLRRGRISCLVVRADG